MAAKELDITGEPVAFLRLELKRGELYLPPYGSLISAYLANRK